MNMNVEKFLNEMSGAPKTLWHFTSTPGLYGILKSGKILGSMFDVNAGTFVRKSEAHPEIATVRPSSNFAKSPEGLTERAGFVKIILYPHIMSDKIHKVKVTPIAEFPLQFMENMVGELKGMKFFKTDRDAARAVRAYAKWYSEQKYAPKYKEGGEGIIDKSGEYSKQLDERLDDLQRWFRKEYRITLTREQANDLDHEVEDYLHYSTIRREGEERISRPHGNIPVNASYMKIELRDGYTDNFKNNLIGNVDFSEFAGFRHSSDYDPDRDRGHYKKHSAEMKKFFEDWKKVVDKYANLFVDNKEFKIFRMALNSLIKETNIKNMVSAAASEKFTGSKPIEKLRAPPKTKANIIKKKLYIDKVPGKIKTNKELKDLTGMDYIDKKMKD
jgi:hypothetical protein